MIIGVYGYMSAGKTTICEYLKKKYQFFVINTDDIAKNIIKNNNEIKKFFKIHYPKVLDENFQVKSFELRKLLFKNIQTNKQISEIIWPFVIKKIKQIVIEENVSQKNIVIEAVTLEQLKLDWTAKIFLYADFKVLIDRIKIRNNLSKMLAAKILEIQTNWFLKNDFTNTFDTSQSFEIVYQHLEKIVLGNK